MTQTLSEDGELVGVTKTVNFDEREVAEIAPQSGFGKATVEGTGKEGTGKEGTGKEGTGKEGTGKEGTGKEEQGDGMDQVD